MGLEIAHQLDLLTLGCNLSAPVQHMDEDCKVYSSYVFCLYFIVRPCSSINLKAWLMLLHVIAIIRLDTEYISC